MLSLPSLSPPQVTVVQPGARGGRCGPRHEAALGLATSRDSRDSPDSCGTVVMAAL